MTLAVGLLYTVQAKVPLSSNESRQRLYSLRSLMTGNSCLIYYVTTSFVYKRSFPPFRSDAYQEKPRCLDVLHAFFAPNVLTSVYTKCDFSPICCRTKFHQIFQSINQFVFYFRTPLRYKHTFITSIGKAWKRAHAAKRVIVEACPSKRLGMAALP